MSNASISSSQLTALLNALGNRNRLGLVDILKHGEKDVTALQNALALGQSTVSQHLAVMRAHKIVKERRVGRRVFYRLTTTSIAEWLANGVVVSAAIQSSEDPNGSSSETVYLES